MVVLRIGDLVSSFNSIFAFFWKWWVVCMLWRGSWVCVISFWDGDDFGVFIFLLLCGDLHPFLLCAVIASHILEKNPNKKGDSTRVSSSDFGEMQLWSITSCSLIVIAEFIQFVSGCFVFDSFFGWILRLLQFQSLKRERSRDFVFTPSS